ncbi:MAG: M14 family zinc carboxypeptidase [Ignavibacteriaceae bacterium]
MKILFFTFLFLSSLVNSQPLKTPLEKSDYNKLTSYPDLIQFLNEAAGINPNLKIEYFAKSIEGRDVPIVKISKGNFGEDDNKIKVLIFAQQHGNEPSGKEGALLLIKKFAEGEYDSLLTKIDFAIVPQMNPDGSEKNKRRNGNDADLNRDHLILLQPETAGLHKIFNQYLFEAAMDVHEYFPYTEDWIEFGYIKNFDEQIGTTTNPNVSKEVRVFSNMSYLPFIKKYLNNKGFSFQNYILGGPPEKELIRHSTYDINDGRQSFGILNSFSFIQEGLNGEGYTIQNIKSRAEGQLTGMLGFLEFIYGNKEKIKNLVKDERAKLIENKSSDKVSIQMDHFKNDKTLRLNLLSLYSNKDTVVVVKNYHPVVKPLLQAVRPEGYLIPKNLTKVIEWAGRQNIKLETSFKINNEKIEEYFVTKIDSINFEGDTVINPKVEVKELPKNFNTSDYYYISTKQLQSNLIVTALEPRSMIGLATYEFFSDLIKTNENYPILRVTKY